MAPKIKHPCITCGAARSAHPLKKSLPPDNAEVLVCDQFILARACRQGCDKEAGHRFRCRVLTAKKPKAKEDPPEPITGGE